MFGAANSKKLKQLRRRPSGLFYFTQSVIFFEYSEIVQLHSPEERLVNRAHHLRWKHRAAILWWKQIGRFREETFSARRLQIHQLNKPRIGHAVA